MSRSRREDGRGMATPREQVPMSRHRLPCMTHGPLPQHTDEALALMAASGDHSAFTELVHRHGPRIFLLAQRYLRSEADARDAVQDALLNAWRHAHRFRGDAAYSSWLHRITANACLMRIRRHRRRPTLPLDAMVVEPRDERARSADAILQDRELSRALDRAIDSLPPHYRTVFTLSDIDHLSMRQVAEHTGLSVANVKTRLHRARLKLRAHLAHYLREDVVLERIA